MLKKTYLTLVWVAAFSLTRAQEATEVEAYPTSNLYLLRSQVHYTNGNAAAGVRAFLSVPGDPFLFRSAVSDSAGTLRFLLPYADTSLSLILQIHPAADTMQVLDAAPPLLTSYLPAAPLALPDLPADTSAFYGVADKTYLLDEYTRFPAMEEIFREYVTEVRIRKTKDDFVLAVLNTPYQHYFEEAPLVLLDGVPVFDFNALMMIDPLKVRQLDVVARRYHAGSLVCYGIVSLTSYSGDLAGYPLPRSARVTRYVTGQK